VLTTCFRAEQIPDRDGEQQQQGQGHLDFHLNSLIDGHRVRPAPLSMMLGRPFVNGRSETEDLGLFGVEFGAGEDALRLAYCQTLGLERDCDDRSE
jgi:hypothetical protein